MLNAHCLKTVVLGTIASYIAIELVYSFENACCLKAVLGVVSS